MAISDPLGDGWGTGLTHAAQAGSNRLLAVTVGNEGGSAQPVATAGTYGGQPLTLIDAASISVLESTTSAGDQIFYCLESEIAAASDGNLEFTWSSTPSASVRYSHAFFSGVDQTSPVVDAAEVGQTTNHTTISTAALTTEAGGLIVASAFSGSGQAATWTAPTTIGNDQISGTNFILSTYYDLTDGSGVTPSVTWASNSARTAMVAASFAPAAGGSVGAASGTSAASGVGASTAAADGSAAGAATVSGVGASVAAAAGSAAGTSSVSGVGSSLVGGEGVGTAAGTSTASAVGASIAAAVGSASGIATVSGVAFVESPPPVLSGGAYVRHREKSREERSREWRVTLARLMEAAARDAAVAAVHGKPEPSKEIAAPPTPAPPPLDAVELAALLDRYGLGERPVAIAMPPIVAVPTALPAAEPVAPAGINREAIIALLLAAA